MSHILFLKHYNRHNMQILSLTYVRTTQFGPGLPIECSECACETHLHLLLHKSWISIFNFPIFPFKSVPELCCANCSASVELAKIVRDETVEETMEKDDHREEVMVNMAYDNLLREASIQN